MRILLLVLCIAALGTSAAKCRERKTPTTTYDGVYLSLGDSVAAGNGASDRNATSFSALLARDEGVDLVNLAVAGATTQDVLDKQLAGVAAAVGGRKPAFITISAGGNDLAALIPNPSCVQDPLPASCPLGEALDGVQRRYAEIVRRLRVEHPSTPIVLLAYPNFFSGTGHAFEAPAARVLPRLDDVIRGVAASQARVAVADPSAAFQGKGGELTHVLDPQFDPHPNDAGHRIIADAFIDALNSMK